MAYPQIKKFDYSEEGLKELNETMEKVKFLDGMPSPIHFRENGIFLVHADGIKQDSGLSLEERIKILKDERASVEMAATGARIDYEVADTRLKRYEGKKGEFAARQATQAMRDRSMAEDTLWQKVYEIKAYDEVIKKMEDGTFTPSLSDLPTKEGLED